MDKVVPQSDVAGAETLLPARKRRWILAALMFTMMLAAMDTTIVSTAIPQIVGDLGGFSLFSWVFSIYLLAQTVTIPIYGKLSDLFGRKPILVVGTLIFLAGSAASAASWSMLALIVFSGLQGLGAGSVMATVTTLAGDLYSVRERGSIQGWLSSVWGIAAIVGPVLGAAALVLIGVFLHEHFERRRPRIDFAGAALILCSVGALIFGLLQGGQAWAWLSAPSVMLFVLALALFGITIWVEYRAAEPIMPGWLWRRRILAGSNLATIGMGLVMMGPDTYLPTFGQSVLGLGAIAAGLVLATMSIGWPVASAVSARFYMRIGFRDTALAGGVLLVLASVGFLLLPYPGPVWAVVLDQVAIGAGFGLLSTPLLVGIQSVVGWEQRGVVTGANMFSRYLGESLGAAVFGAIFNSTVAGDLGHVPAALAGKLPHNINDVIDVLQAKHMSHVVEGYLRHTIYLATHYVWTGMTAVALIMVIIVLLTPRHFLPDGATKP